ncbi:MAG TPA: RCC1 domain-containing protein, partial [Acidimicrobiia bacterium]|nr:RCC1 domain-containing protein [Acidimicrobiia bacterium]
MLEEEYHVNWKTKGARLPNETSVRVTVSIDGAAIGSMVVKLVGAGGRGAKNGTSISVHNGSTLPIKFRLGTPDYDALLFKGQVAAGWTGDSEVIALALHTDGSRLAVIAGPGPTGVDGAVLTLPDGKTITVAIDSVGLPTQAVFDDVIVLFRNYTATTVDLGIIQPNDEIRIVRGVPFDRSGLSSPSLLRSPSPAAGALGADRDPRSSLVLSIEFLDGLRGVLQFGADAIEIASCAAGAVAALGSAGAAIPLAIIGCQSVIVSVLNEISPGDEDVEELLESGSSLAGIPSIVRGGLSCLRSGGLLTGAENIAECVNFLVGALGGIWGAIADYIDDHAPAVTETETQLAPDFPPPPDDPPPPPPGGDYTLALTPAALTINPGATGSTTVTISRTDFTGPVTLSLGGAPSGVTGSFTPAAPTGTSATLTVSVGATVNPGVYNLTVEGTGSAGNRSTPLALGSGLTFAVVSAGSSHTCGVTPSGAAYCWGNNSFPVDGQLGDGTQFTNRLVPTPVAGGLTFAAVSA